MSTTLQKTIHIEGMSCAHCVNAVTKALQALPGVINAKVDLTAKTAIVTADAAVTDEKLRNAVTALEFDVVAID